jgi:hypothetical protein
MSRGLVVQTKKHGAITLFDVVYKGRLIATLIKEGTKLVDYSRRRVFHDFDAAFEFYLTRMAPQKDRGLLTVGSLEAENAFVLHDCCFSFPL